MAALGVFHPGVFTATFGGVALGLTTGDGWKLTFRRSRIPINNTNLYGDTLIDGIFRGISNARLITTLKEFNAAAQSAMWPNGASGFDGTLGTISVLDTSKAAAIVLTPVTSSPAIAAGPSNAVLTLSNCILSADNDVDFLFGPVEADMPIAFDVMLYDDAGTKRLWKWS